jgi:hypothetical protein
MGHDSGGQRTLLRRIVVSGDERLSRVELLAKTPRRPWRK